MTDRLLALARIGFAVLVLAAIAFMIWTLVDEGSFNALNFFTFFTILSNLFAAGVLFEGGRRQLTGAPPVPDLWRGAAVVYMSVTYIVFAVLLRDAQEDLNTHVPWVDSVLHRLMPIAVMADWLIAPPQVTITFRRALVWLGFPAGVDGVHAGPGRDRRALSLSVPEPGERWIRHRGALLRRDPRALPRGHLAHSVGGICTSRAAG